MDKNDLVPIIDYAVEKAMRESGKPDSEIKDLQNKIGNKILTDREVDAKIEILTPDRGSLPGFRAAVRPILTLLLSFTFIFLIIIPFFKEISNWGEIFSAFMGVFGTIVGFWFGERTALKLPGKQE
ncbi:MAG: hypothetical protein ACOZFS_11655 [Thermodesulfobacteriota bacterium]